MSNAIVVDKMSFCYGKRPILTDVDLTIEEGEFVGFIGPNGGGKTTLFRLLLGLLKPHRGTISLHGQPPQITKDRVGYVPQSMHFDRQFPITVLDVVLAGILHRAPWFGGYRQQQIDRAAQALTTVGLFDKADTPFSRLSGGQMQRTLIARALVADPDVLLLDEPTANIDAPTEAEIHNLLRELKGEKTILMVTHNFDVALDLVDRVVCVQNRVDTLAKEQVCEHFAIGIYHPPLPEQEKE